jgi:glucan biosynthesis protein C
MNFAQPEIRQAARGLLLVGVAAPIFAFLAVLIAAVSYAGFDHARQYLSELGGETAAQPWIFNFGVMIAGVLTGVAGFGFGLAVVILTRSPVSAVLVGLLFVLAGIGLVMSSLYPWPDPRHMAINLGLGIQLAPVFLLVALRQSLELTRLKRFLGLVFVIMAVLTVLTKHLVFPGTVNDFNVGYWERAFAIVLVGWVGVAAHLLRRALTP